MEINNEAKKEGILGKSASIFFGMFFAVIGLLGIGFLLYIFWITVQIEYWPKSDAVILESKINSPEGNDNKYKLKVKYSYTVDGNSYESAGLHPQYHGNSSYVETQSIMKQFPVGKKVKCYYNPDDKGIAYLFPKISWVILPFTIIPLALVVVGSVFFKKAFTVDPKYGENSIEKSNSKTSSNLGPFILCGIFIILGLILFYVMTVGPLIDSLSCQGWIETPCEIVRCKVKTPPRSSGSSSNAKTRSYVDILYKYIYKGEKYHSDIFSFLGGASYDYEYVQKIVDQYPIGGQSVCFVNPNDPGTAVISKEIDMASLFLGFIPLFFTLFGIGGLILFSKKKKTPKINAYSYSKKTS